MGPVHRAAASDAVSAAPSRYRAFISYSHRDKAVVKWMHRAIETYQMPRKLVGRVTPLGAVPPRITPIFRDRDELSASSDLTSELCAALAQSMFLIVVCSPTSARSSYVNQELLTFKRLHGEARTLALIVGGQPAISPGKTTADDECFPLALRFRLGTDGELSDAAAAPIAADLRPDADGKRLALLKLLAGLTGLSLDELVQREAQRRTRRLTVLVAASLTATVLTGGLALYANAQRQRAEDQRRVAERESAAAKAAANFMVGTFTLSNPGSENPRTITAFTILERSAERARTELARQPAIQLRLLSTVALAYNNLGLFKEARDALEPALTVMHDAGPEGATALLTLATTYWSLGKFPEATAAVRQAEQQLGSDPSEYIVSRAYAAELMGRIDREEVKLAPSIAEYDRALSLYAKVPDIDTRSVARTLNNLGLALSDLGRFDDAQDSLLRANALLRKAYGGTHLLVGQSWFSLAQNAFAAGRFTEAERYITQAIGVLRPVLDPDNPILADSLSLQGQIFEADKRFQEAKDSLSQAIAVYRKGYGGPHFLIGIADVYLGLVESDLGNTAAALDDLDDAKRNYDASYGHLHENHGDLLVYRAIVLKRANRLGEARENCTAGLEIMRKVGAENSGLYAADSQICRTL